MNVFEQIRKGSRGEFFEVKRKSPVPASANGVRIIFVTIKFIYDE